MDQALADYFDLEPNAELSLAQQTALKKVGLEEIVERFKSVDAPSLNCSELSTGQFLRLAIVRAALSKPSFLIIDEPFSPLDYRAAKRVEAYLKKIKRDGVGVVITSHQLNKLIVDECFDIEICKMETSNTVLTVKQFSELQKWRNILKLFKNLNNGDTDFQFFYFIVEKGISYVGTFDQNDPIIQIQYQSSHLSKT